jgi:Spy/CpxP family protein refolding chaperone
MPMMGGGMKHDGKGMMETVFGEDHPLWKHLQGLDLDEKQKEAVRGIKSRHMKDMIRMKAEWQIAKLELHDMLGNDPVDLKAVEGKLKQIGEIETKISLSKVKAIEEIKTKLTPAQRDKVKQMSGMEMMGGMGMMHGCKMMQEMMQQGDPGKKPAPAKGEETQPAMEHKHH